MKRMFSTLAFAALLGLGTAGFASATGSSGLATGAPVSASDLVHQVRDDCGRWGCRDRFDGRRHFRGDSSRYWRDGWDRRDWRDRRHHRRHYRSGPSFHLYIEPRVFPRYVDPRPVYRLSRAHISWCHARYRSYRVWDNSWQPYHGPRRVCVSPFR